ncbi:MAG: hypothetical protein U9Q30_02225 [Campylobacterota bacterium]|nr:hypothetical protein [Campylobacterota bacterium]
MSNLTFGKKIVIPVILILIFGNIFYTYISTSKMRALSMDEQYKHTDMLSESIFKSN